MKMMLKLLRMLTRKWQKDTVKNVMNGMNPVMLSIWDFVVTTSPYTSSTELLFNCFFFAGKHELPLSTQSYNLLQRADEARRNRNSGRMEMPCHILFYVSFVLIVTKKLMF